MWRPEGWKNPYKPNPIDKAHPNSPWSECPENKVFELGADTLLKAIWKMAEESPTGTFTFDSKPVNIYRKTRPILIYRVGWDDPK